MQVVENSPLCKFDISLVFFNYFITVFSFDFVLMSLSFM